MRQRVTDKVLQVFERAEQIQRSPGNPREKQFSRYGLAPKDVQFAGRRMPANMWFVDVGSPRESYGPYGVVRVDGPAHISRGKLAPALCPHCGSPIFTILLCEQNQGNANTVRQQCIMCGYQREVGRG